jgi:hypothetical protein
VRGRIVQHARLSAASASGAASEPENKTGVFHAYSLGVSTPRGLWRRATAGDRRESGPPSVPKRRSSGDIGPRPGVLRLMDEARAAGLAVSVRSAAATTSGAEQLLGSLLGEARAGALQCVVAGEDAGLGRPDAEVFKVRDCWRRNGACHVPDSAADCRHVLASSCVGFQDRVPVSVFFWGGGTRPRAGGKAGGNSRLHDCSQGRAAFWAPAPRPCRRRPRGWAWSLRSA